MSTPKSTEDTRCVCCVVEANDDVRDEDEVSEGIGECVYCHQQSCEWHGHEYRIGFAHEACHEAPDFTRAEDGEY